MSTVPDGADDLAARIGSLGVYATRAELVALYRTPAERAMRTLLTFIGTLLLMPLAFLIPPHMEPPGVVLLFGLYFTRRAWVGDWEVVRMNGTCPRCTAPLTLKKDTVLYLPHSLTCAACRSECWLELGAAPEIDDEVRERARLQREEPPAGDLDGRPPLTWSPAASDWRDRKRA